MSGALPVLHAEFVESVRSEVARDERLAALLAGGSYIHGGLDAHSDLDFVILAEEEKYGEVEMLGGPAVECLARTIPALDVVSVREAFMVAADMYVDLRNDEPPRETVKHMPQALQRYLYAT